MNTASISKPTVAQLWDDTAFIERMAAYAAIRGRNLREVCKAAGLSATYLDKPAERHGRSIESILKLGPELGISLSELIGVDRISPQIEAGLFVMSDAVTLDFLATQQRPILDEIAALRAEFAVMRTQHAATQDDIRVLSAMAMRQDNTTRNILDLLHTITAQQNRLSERLARIESERAGTEGSR